MGGVVGGNLDRRRDDVMTTACLWIMLVAWDAQPDYVPAPGLPRQLRDLRASRQSKRRDAAWRAVEVRAENGGQAMSEK
jgi:hypothetical protein